MVHPSVTSLYRRPLVDGGCVFSHRSLLMHAGVVTLSESDNKRGVMKGLFFPQRLTQGVGGGSESGVALFLVANCDNVDAERHEVIEAHGYLSNLLIYSLTPLFSHTLIHSFPRSQSLNIFFLFLSGIQLHHSSENGSSDYRKVKHCGQVGEAGSAGWVGVGYSCPALLTFAASHSVPRVTAVEAGTAAMVCILPTCHKILVGDSIFLFFFNMVKVGKR